MAVTTAETLVVAGQVGGEAGAAAGERPTFVEGYGETRADLPAFLKEGELPKGYVAVDIPRNEKQLIQLGSESGSEMVFYVGNVGVELRREAEGIYFRLAGLELPNNIFPHEDIRDIDKEYAPSLTNIGPQGIKLIDAWDEGGFDIWLLENRNRASREVEGATGYRVIYLYLPHEVEMTGGEIVQIDDIGTTIIRKREDNIRVDHLLRSNLRIAVPARAARSAGAVASLGEMRGEQDRAEAGEAVTEEVAAEEENVRLEGRGISAEKIAEVVHMPERVVQPELQTPEMIFPAESVTETAQQKFSRLVDEVKTQIQDPAAERTGIRNNLLELFDMAAEITAEDPAGEQKLVRSLSVLLRVAKEKQVIFSDETAGMTEAERRAAVGELVDEVKKLVVRPDLSEWDQILIGGMMRQLLDHTVALGSGDKMGVSLARLLRIAGGKQVKLGGE